MFRCRADGATIRVPHVWERIVGGEHATFALRADYQAHLRRAHEQLGFESLRFHGLLSDDVGVVIRQGSRREYSWYNVFRIWDSLLALGVRPFVELSFMPGELASGHATVFSYRGNVTPPRNYRDWGRLNGALVRAAVDRYGADEVAEWHFEVWNEPNLRAFWRGSQSDYFRLYREAALAIKDVDSRFRVGGPATAKNEWLEEFIGYCDRNDVPVDFVSTHHYPTDLAGPTPLDTRAVLAATPRDVLRQQAQDARRRAGHRQLFYTEWNSSSNARDPLHDEPYAACFAVRACLDAALSVDAYSFWVFSDLFEESHLPSVPYHGGFGLLTLYGTPKPVYRAFELLRRLGEDMLAVVDGIHETMDARVFVDRAGASAMVTNFAMPGQNISSERVVLAIETDRDPASVTLTVIDEGSANAKPVWVEMGSPTYPTAAQLAELGVASELQERVLTWRRQGQAVEVEWTMQPYSVALARLAW